MNYRNMLIDAGYPLVFWGLIYLTMPLIHFWSWDMYISWYIAMFLFSPLNAISGRIINTWRRKLNYQYKGYE